MATALTNRSAGRLRRAQRLAVNGLSTGLVLTGAAWLYYFYFVRVVDQFGFENPHPAQHYFLVAHALMALPSVWLFGLLWPIHVKPGWRARSKRWSGGTLWSLVLWMSLTGYALYYIGDDGTRAWLALSHWVAGIVAPGIFLWHRRNAGQGINCQK